MKAFSPLGGAGNPGPGAPTAAIDANSTTITVTGASAITSSELTQPSGYVIQLDNEQMQITAVKVVTVAQPSGTVAQGSAVIAGLTSTAKLAVGESIRDAAGNIPQGTTTSPSIRPTTKSSFPTTPPAPPTSRSPSRGTR